LCKSRAKTVGGLSDAGKEKEEIVIPVEINGVPVVKIDKRIGLTTGGLWESDNLKKYIIRNILKLIFMPFLMDAQI
jgi:hypothetical protein